MSKIRLSPAQIKALDNLASGRPIGQGIAGRSAHGGLAWTIEALRTKGMIDPDGNITDIGKQAIGVKPC